MTWEKFSRPLWGRLALFIVVLDWSIPGGFLNRVFHRHHWFPTNITGLIAGHLSDPSGAGAVFAVSSSTPLFWTLLAATVWVAVSQFRRPGGARAPAVLLAVLFILAELVLPWWGENGALEHPWDSFFPVVPRGQGRAYEMAYLYAAPLFVLLWALRRRAHRADGHLPPIRVK